MRAELIDILKSSSVDPVSVQSLAEYDQDYTVEEVNARTLAPWGLVLEVLAVLPPAVVTVKIPAGTVGTYNIPYTASDLSEARAFSQQAFIGGATSFAFLPNTICLANFTSMGATWGVGITSFDIYPEGGTFAFDTYIKIQ